jgi:hypothetical protein
LILSVAASFLTTTTTLQLWESYVAFAKQQRRQLVTEAICSLSDMKLECPVSDTVSPGRYLAVVTAESVVNITSIPVVSLIHPLVCRLQRSLSFLLKVMLATVCWTPIVSGILTQSRCALVMITLYYTTIPRSFTHPIQPRTT